MLSGMILWLPLIVLRSFIIGRNTILVDGMLLLTGVVCILAQDFVFQIKASWQHLPAYAVCGMLVFALSVSVTTSHPVRYLRQVLRTIQCRGRSVQKRVVWSAVITALSEEIVWRVVFQTILSVAIGTYASIAVVAASFALLHRHRTTGITVQFVELLAFSLILGGLFALTHDVMAVIVVHAIRNYLIGIQGADCEAR